MRWVPFFESTTRVVSGLVESAIFVFVYVLAGEFIAAASLVKQYYSYNLQSPILTTWAGVIGWTPDPADLKDAVEWWI